MAATEQRETMRRKPILMPPAMISRIDKIAKDRAVSFAAVVREAVDAFDDHLSMEDEALLGVLADTMIASTQDVIKKIEALEKRLDKTHTMLEAQ